MRSRAIFITVCAIVLLAAGAYVLTAWHHRDQRPPPIDGLRDALERSAKEAIAEPSLSSDRILETLPPDRLAVRARAITEKVNQLKGTAIQTSGDAGEIKLMIQLPSEAVAGFYLDITGHARAATPGPAGSTEFVDVVLHPSAGGSAEGSPTPQSASGAGS